MKKVLVLALSLVLAASLAISGTIAYLTDEDSDVNVMTMGSVEIEQIEQEWDADGDLQDFSQLKPLLPYVGELGWKNTGAYRQFSMNNVVDKVVTVENTGKSDAFVRTVFAFEMGEYDNIADWQYKVIGTSFNEKGGASHNGEWLWTGFEVAQIEGKNYAIRTATREEALPAGETSEPSLLQIYMNKECDNEEVEAVDGNKNGLYDVLVFTQAVQAAGFDTAEAAFNASFGAISATNHPWLAGVNGAPETVDPKTAQDKLDKAEEGATITLLPGEYSDLEIKADNVTIIGAPGAKIETVDVKAHQNITIKGVTFDAADAVPVYKKGGVDSGYVASITNSNVNNGPDGVVIENCTFAGTPDNASTYVPICFEDQGKPSGRTANVTIRNCKFETQCFNYIRMNYLEQGDVVITGNKLTGGSWHNAMNFTGNAANLTITGNTIANWNTDKSALGTSRQNVNHIDIVVTGNTFDNATLGTEGKIIDLKSSYTAENSALTMSGNSYLGGLASMSD